MPWIKKNECRRCGVCVSVCPVNAIFMDETGRADIKQDVCTKCGACMDVCPVGIILPNSQNPSLRGGGGGGRGGR